MSNAMKMCMKQTKRISQMTELERDKAIAFGKCNSYREWVVNI